MTTLTSIGTFDDNVLSEDNLRTLSRSVKSLLPKNEDEIKILCGIFDKLFQTVPAANLTAPHRAAAWNALCALIDQCAASPDPAIRAILWDYNIWTRAYDSHVSQAHNARPKSSRQVLVTLTSALQKASGETKVVDQIKKDITKRQIDSLIEENDHSKAKVSASSLAHFLSKGVVNLDNVLNAFNSSEKETSVDQKLADILLSLFQWMSKGDFGSAIAHLVSMILNQTAPADQSSEKSSILQSLPVWVQPLETAFQSDLIESSALRAHLLPVLFKRNLNEYAAFLNKLGLQQLLAPREANSRSTSGARLNEELLFASLQSGKELGLVHETDSEDISIEQGALLIPVSAIARLLARGSRPARLAGFSLVVFSHSATRPILSSAIVALKNRLSNFLADSDANFRSEVFSLIQRLVDRIRSVTAALARQANKPPVTQRKTGDLSPAENLKCHREFLEWLVICLGWELRPTASYQRHISGLKCLSIVARSGLDNRIDPICYSKTALSETKWAFTIDVLTPSLHRLLLDLLIDPFDDVRQLAASILKLPITSPESTRGIVNLPEIQQALERAESAMLATGRADHADGVANLYTLLYHQSNSKTDVIDSLIAKLERMLNIGKVDITQAVEKYPIHGLLTSVRYIMVQEMGSSILEVALVSRLSTCLRDVWEVVKPVLCDDAPEGYLPEGLEETEGVSTKDTLSYCWRALKEASLLLDVLVSCRNDGNTMEILNDLSALCFTQLAELRHRGAFSTVAQTWVTCCTQNVRASATAGASMLQGWYDQVMLILRNKTTINTRRSAGLPSLLCGALIAEKSDDILRQAFADLEVIAREAVDPAFAQEGSLPQVHAMNCMKDVLKNTRLGEKSERYVPVALQLAADALRSESWAVRNCGLMLFRGVIDRLLKTSDSNVEDDREQKKLPADQHTGLLDIVLALLSAPAAAPTGLSSGSEGVFPALHLLQRMQVPEEVLPKVRQAVFALTTSGTWHIRDKAARTYASLVREDQILEVVRCLLCTDHSSQNALHGALLCARYIINRLSSHQTSLKMRNSTRLASSKFHSDLSLEIVRVVCQDDGLVPFYHENDCPVTQGAYLDVLIESVTLVAVLGPSEEILKSLIQDLQKSSSSDLGRLDIESELSKHLSARSQGAYHDAVSLTALARLYAPQITLLAQGSKLQSSTIIQIVKQLADHNADAGVEFFKAIDKDLAIEQKFGTTIEAIMEACAATVAAPEVDSSVRCAAQRTLVEIIDQNAGTEDKYHKLLAPWMSPEFLDPNANPEYADLWLQLQSASVERNLAANTASEKELQSLVNNFTSGLVETGLYSREATALSIGRLTTLWPTLARSYRTSPSFLRICLLVYDLLNDDDEDLRQQAACAATHILQTTNTSSTHQDITTLPDLDPIVANEEILRLITHTWSSSPSFLSETLSRAFGITSPSTNQPATPHATLITLLYLQNTTNSVTPTDTALFAEEKQNLYIEPAREAQIWARQVPSLPLDAETTGLLREYVTNNLSLLINHATAHVDGALGWSSAAEVFPLGLAVLYGAEAVLAVSEKDGNDGAIETPLAEMASVFHAQGVNGLWIAELERVMNAAGCIGEQTA